MRKEYENTKKIAQQYRTGKLWLQYMEMISILKQFIQAEREGDWKGHLKAFQKCSLISQLRDNLYLKSSNVYLQEMSKLEESHPAVYKSLLDGNHIVRRSDRFWGGLSTDRVIEQVLMRSVKSVGGMTRGRGLSAAQRA